MSIPWNDGIREFVLAFADDEHLMGQQHAEWIGVAPFLEEDLAFCSIGQDELGHAALLYALVAGDGNGDGVDDRMVDALAFDPDPARWRSCHLVEAPTSEWSRALVRHWLYDAAERLRWELVADSALDPLAETATRAEREEWFHRRHADGLLDVLLPVADSGERLRVALVELLPVAVGLFDPVAGEVAAVEAGVTAAPFDTRLPEWTDRIRTRFDVDLPDLGMATAALQAGRTVRSEAFGPVLSRIREVLDLDPAAVW
ncbi:MAG: 1,2-phenylacetyl-CoA epoxidase subunit PaaC [Actinomycetota bacterium]|nr:1,2-phenylacetyl-CoA epoxidase subunit PaaC [Actinomycetota bacterium]MEC9394418.1 1,2-phenylacetyl-CoA epoxidase subunit PaaC [Actinomycetota bacterium]MEC9466950.1 1,2-phenylacetyl-CoA epoxidase subunit PaaC [Actinomycetota bacterium]MED6327504.1 1,2-phenylacetyl-CoA epoxidase subunit PaaC [Actinomycetota bacterium]MEE2959054.1 1,2-phenylacetyl-CoA epoxidase subunit PaaC [Actinomycetota bacterium]